MPKIAIIEDDQAISQMYRFKFETEGYEVQTADNGKLGLTLIDSFKPDIVLLDLMMPEIPDSVRGLGVSAVILKADMTPRQVAELVHKQLNP
jgi:DNA-binding response OmpR family regulator